MAKIAEEGDMIGTYCVQLLRQMLQDDNDSVKIMAVYSTTTVVKGIKQAQKEVVRQEIIPPFKVAVENKMASWRLRFSVAEVAG